MLIPHATELDQMPGLAAKTEPIPGGVRLTVTARDAEDGKAVARVRGLGFIGLLTLGAHHQSHHLAMARGQTMPGHGH
jgi:threonine dehydrogenase-like Zn-dependent dehydrogenase